MQAIQAFDATIKRARAVLQAHERLRGPGRGKRPRSHADVLRAAVVITVSAMDAYFHDKILENVRRVVRKTAPNFPQQLVKLLAEDSKAEQIVSKFLKISMASRPLAHIRTEVRKSLSERAFQDPGKIDWGMKIIGVNNFWRDAARKAELTEKQLKDSVQKYVRRRNEIVHQGDLGTSKKRKHRVQGINREYVVGCVDEIERFVHNAESTILRPHRRRRR